MSCMNMHCFRVTWNECEVITTKFHSENDLIMRMRLKIIEKSCNVKCSGVEKHQV